MVRIYFVDYIMYNIGDLIYNFLVYTMWKFPEGFFSRLKVSWLKGIRNYLI